MCVKFTAFCDLRIRLATLRKSVCKFWFCKLALTCVDLRVRLARALHMTAVSCHLSSISGKRRQSPVVQKKSRLKAATSHRLDINSYTHRLFMVGWFSTILQVRTHTHKHTQSSHNKNLTVYSGETKSFGSVGHRHQKTGACGPAEKLSLALAPHLRTIVKLASRKISTIILHTI